MLELTSIEGVGEIVALQLRDGIHLRKAFISDLLVFLTIQQEKLVEAGGPLEGMTFCVTGTLSESRKSIQARIKAGGGKVVSSVSGNLSVLVAGENAGSKLAKGLKNCMSKFGMRKPLLQRLSETTTPPENKPATTQPTLFDY